MSNRAIALTLVLLLASCSSSTTDTPPQGESGLGPGAAAREPYTFDDLRVMVATADAVVVATVEGTEPGRSIGDPEAPLDFTDVDFRVTQALKWDVESQRFGLEVSLLPDEVVAGREASYASAGLFGRSTFSNGQTFLLVLHQIDDEGTLFRILNSQSVYLLDGGDLRSIAGDAFSSQVADMDVQAIRDAVEAALRDVEAGLLVPQPPSR